MAFRHGRLGEVTVNTKDLSSFLDSADLNLSTEHADTTTFKALWKTNLPGLNSGTFDVAGGYDPTATTGPQAVLGALQTAPASVVVLYYPGGNLTGQKLHTFNAIMTSYKQTSKTSDQVNFTASFILDGADVETVVP